MNAPRSNTTHLDQTAVGQVWSIADGDNRWRIRVVADGGTDGLPLIIAEKVDADDTLIADHSRVELDLGILSNAGVGFREMKIRETTGCDDDGNARYCLMLRTKWYTDPVLDDQD